MQRELVKAELKRGVSVRNVAKMHGVSPRTVQKINQVLHDEELKAKGRQESIVHMSASAMLEKLESRAISPAELIRQIGSNGLLVLAQATSELAKRDPSEMSVQNLQRAVQTAAQSIEVVKEHLGLLVQPREGGGGSG